jgi:hypothetical protein
MTMMSLSFNYRTRKRARGGVFSPARVRHNRLKFVDLVKGHTNRHERAVSVSKYLKSVLGRRWLSILDRRQVVSSQTITSWLVGEVTPSKPALKRVEDYACSLGYTPAKKRDGVKAKQKTIEVQADSSTQALGVLQDLAGQIDMKQNDAVPAALENGGLTLNKAFVESHYQQAVSISSTGVSLTNLPTQSSKVLSSSSLNELASS